MVRFRRIALSALLLVVAASSAQNKKKSEAHHSAPHKARHHAPSKHTEKHTTRSGSSVERRDGHVSRVHDERRHMDIQHHIAGGRRVSVERADHSRIVAEYGRGGYIEHPYSYGGHAYYHRTYYRFGRPAGFHVYREYGWHGYHLHIWRPYHYWHPAYYRWAWHPWGVRVVYAWPYYHRPWYGYYGYYFAPAPYYNSASAWLTDYTISQALAADYSAREMNHESLVAMHGPADDMHPPLLTPDVKDQIDQEIQDELKAEDVAAELLASSPSGDAPDNDNGIQQLFADGKQHVFVVSEPLDVEDADTGDPCALGPGDVLRTTEAPGAEDTNADLTVIASRQTDKECGPNTVVSVGLDALQEMQNSLREHIADGLEDLQKKQGTDGIPALPADATGTIPTAYAAAAPEPDRTAGKDIDDQFKAADQSEQEVTAEESSETPAPAPAPASQAPAPIERRPPAQ